MFLSHLAILKDRQHGYVDDPLVVTQFLIFSGHPESHT